ncbi:MAG TPA: Dam family site-specific DNA-(adenine-N6)-methyltransferase [Conexibacter sp.]|nr:Dam family site-specific DNA-(adenine-N6)-methyltransferase [Conexibacter sp.]
MSATVQQSPFRDRSGRIPAPDDQPFLKWAGGKRWIARGIASLFGDSPGCYFEPFLGSGAVFFALRPSRAVLSDTNRDLIAAFRTARTRPTALVSALSALDISQDTFARIRAQVPANDFERAVRLLYLNRTAFNGLWRVNQQGTFNVPYGCKPGTRSVDPTRLRRCAQDLSGATLRVADFRKALNKAEPGDCVYLDPPYTVTHNNNGFRRYNEHIFSWADQEALATIATDLGMRGIHVIVTNACHKDVELLYGDQFSRCYVHRTSRMAASTTHRKARGEMVIATRSLAGTDSQLASAFTRAVSVV